MEDDIKHLEDVLRHISNVRSSCELLGERLINKGEYQIGIELIGLGLIHDYSKIHNQNEFKYLRPKFYGTPEFQCALTSHITTNPHHPEAWSSIEEMPRVYLAEMVCDWKSRSSEFGNDLTGWIKDKATSKFQFSKTGSVYKEIKEIVGLLLDRGF